MHRNWLAPLFAIALGGASCGSQWSSPPAGAPRLAAVQLAAPADAAPPPVAAAAAADVAGATRTALDEVSAYLGRKRTGLTPSEVRRVARTLIEQAERHDIDPRLVLALIHVESRYDTFAVSKVGALGLMQILPSTGEELALRLGVPWHGPHTLFDPEVNLRLGIAYMRQLADRFGSVPAALAAYNWGPGHVAGRIRRGTPLPQVYPALVLSAYDEVVPESSSS